MAALKSMLQKCSTFHDWLSSAAHKSMLQKMFNIEINYKSVLLSNSKRNRVQENEESIRESISVCKLHGQAEYTL